jgi:uncharacterized protein GlcG (DUF336 family)
MITCRTTINGLVVAVGLISSQANAQGPIQIPSIPSALAIEAAVAAKDACREMGFRVSVTVVDAGGTVMAIVREDGAGPHTLSTSQRKAYTALSTRMPTEQAVKMVTDQPAAFGFREIEGFLLLGGGLPIKAGEATIGAIGVSGAPGGGNDEKCGDAGIASVADRLKM